MSKSNKLISRFQKRPNDFHWDELTAMMKQLGFVEIQGNGSRVKFYHKEKNRIFQLHKPHPKKILKKYMMKEILIFLTKEGLL